MTTKDLAVQDKKELVENKEATRPIKVFSPNVDIYEDKESLHLIAEIPGVKSEKVDINLENRVLTIDARIDIDEYKGLRPLYGEYNIGNFSRQFTLGEDIDEERIEAKVEDGLLFLHLPKMKEAVARKIQIK